MKKLLILFSCITSLAASAQLNGDSVKAQLVKDWERAKTYTNEYLQAMPADKYTYRPHDSVRTFAEQMLHLAQGNIGFAFNGTGKDRIWVGRQLEKSATAQNRDSVVYYVNASYDHMIDAIKNVDASIFGKSHGRGSFTETRLTWLNKGFEHQTHHRGQTTIYIRMLGIKPPPEKLF